MARGSGDEDDYYQILELEPSASQEEITRQYRQKAREWHPDRNRERREEATAMFKRISAAYEVLSDPRTRQEYDERRSGGPQRGAFHMPHRFHDPFEVFDAMFTDLHGRQDPFGSLFASDPFFAGFGPMGGQVGRTGRSSPFDGFFGGADPFSMGADPFRMGADPFGMGADPFGVGASGRMSQGASFSQSWSSTAGSNVQSQTTTTRTFTDANGRLVTRTETTIVHPDGRRETTSNESVNESGAGRLMDEGRAQIGFRL